MFFSESTSRFRLIALNWYMLLHQGWLNDNLLLTFHKSDFDTSDLIKRLADYDARSEAVAWCSFFFKSTLISVIVNILVMDDSHSESTYNLQGILYTFIGYNCNKVCTGERANISVINYTLSDYGYTRSGYWHLSLEESIYTLPYCTNQLDI